VPVNRSKAMAKETEVQVLSHDELDSVVGGRDVVVCIQTASFKFWRWTFHFASCDNGANVVYTSR
jgi:hypothetical protein